MTIVVQISNTDNKLSQSQWSEFVRALRKAIQDSTQHVHFEGGSPWDAPTQNACWVADHRAETELQLFTQLTNIRKIYLQDSVAVTIGETEFI